MKIELAKMVPFVSELRGNVLRNVDRAAGSEAVAAHHHSPGNLRGATLAPERPLHDMPFINRVRLVQTERPAASRASEVNQDAPPHHTNPRVQL